MGHVPPRRPTIHFWYFTLKLYNVSQVTTFISDIFRILCTVVVKISYFFIILKNKRVSGFFHNTLYNVYAYTFVVC